MAKYHQTGPVGVECEDCGAHGPIVPAYGCRATARVDARRAGWRIYEPENRCDDNHLASKFLCPTCRTKQDQPKRTCRTCDYGIPGERTRRADEEPCNTLTSWPNNKCPAWRAIGEGEDLPSDEPAV